MHAQSVFCNDALVDPEVVVSDFAAPDSFNYRLAQDGSEELVPQERLWLKNRCLAKGLCFDEAFATQPCNMDDAQS